MSPEHLPVVLQVLPQLVAGPLLGRVVVRESRGGRLGSHSRVAAGGPPQALLLEGRLRPRLGGRVARLRRGGGRPPVGGRGAELDPFAAQPAAREVVARVDAVLAAEELRGLTFNRKFTISDYPISYPIAIVSLHLARSVVLYSCNSCIPSPPLRLRHS